MNLQGLDEYEGINKGYYHRQAVAIDLVEAEDETLDVQRFSCQGRVHADVYFKTESSDALRQGPFLEEYALEWHKEHYHPIQHIWVKQELYMHGDSPASRHST